jgi:shikimate kinase
VVILVIGPSGVGKSDYGKHASEAISGCQFFDLDSVLHERLGTPVSQLLPQIGSEAFLDRCQGEVCRVMASCRAGITVIAVGAGALQSRRAKDWILGHQGPTVAVVAAPDEVYNRGGARNQQRTFEEFAQTEYSEYREDLYGTARSLFCVTRLSVLDARGGFTALIRKLADGTNRDNVDL